jgi:RHS repeat-associated protein
MHIGKQHYYPFGMEMPDLGMSGANVNEYRYNDKEHESDHGLHWYHYGARYYDPQLGRWHNIDPADELVSPYGSFMNNPVYFVDPDGRQVSGYGQTVIRGFALGFSFSYAKVIDDQGWKGYAMSDGWGLYIGMSWSLTVDAYLYPNMHSIFDLAGKSTSTGASAGHFISTGVEWHSGDIPPFFIDFDRNMKHPNTGFSYNVGISIGTIAEAHSLSNKTKVYALSRNEMSQVQKSVEIDACTFNRKNEGFLELLDYDGNLVETTDIYLYKLSENAFASPDAISEYFEYQKNKIIDK